MRTGERVGAAAAITAAITGAGFASGREIVIFFGRFGAAGYAGAALAAVLLGWSAAKISLLAARYGTGDMPLLLKKITGRTYGSGIAMTVTLLAISAAMLAAGGELGALLMDIHGARQIGTLVTALVAAVCALCGMRGMGMLGGLTALVVGGYYVVLLCGGAQISYVDYKPGALICAGSYAAFNLVAACGVIGETGGRLRGDGGMKSAAASIGRYTGALMGAMLIIAVACVRGHWEECADAALPTVIIAARLGVAGYYATIFAMWMAVVSTLAGTLLALGLRAEAWNVGRREVLLAAVSAALLVSCAGFEPLVDKLYPVLGGLCAAYMLPLLLNRKATP